MMENHFKKDDLGVPLFSETSIWMGEVLKKICKDSTGVVVLE